MQAEAMKLLADAVSDFAKALHSVAETMAQPAIDAGVTQIQSGGDGNVQIGNVTNLEIDNSDSPPPAEVVTEPPPMAEPEAKAEPPFTEDDVRRVLGKKSQAGFTAQAKALITKYGAKMVSELDPKHYAAIIAEAEEIK